MRLRALTASLLLFVCVSAARAATYELPEEGTDVVGEITTVVATYEDTLVDLARTHGIGYQDIVRANPDVDVWIPGEGTEVVLPTRFILPPGPREGIVLNLACAPGTNDSASIFEIITTPDETQQQAMELLKNIQM